jgi:hypothetical protein
MGPYIMQFEYNSGREIVNTFLSSKFQVFYDKIKKMALSYVVSSLTHYCHGLLMVAASEGSIVSCKDDS